MTDLQTDQTQPEPDLRIRKSAKWKLGEVLAWIPTPQDCPNETIYQVPDNWSFLMFLCYCFSGS